METPTRVANQPMIVLYQDGQALELNEHPSLLGLIHAGHRALNACNKDIKSLTDRLHDLEVKLELYPTIGMSVKGLKATVTRTKNRIQAIRSEMEAIKAHYVEVPMLDSRFLESHEFQGASLPSDTPVDVVRALAHAKKKNLFDEFRIVLPTPSSTGRDPMIVGVAGNRHFYVASWNPNDL